MSNYRHQTVPTQFVEAAGIRFAYRRFANRRNGPKIDIPLLFFMHFTGTMDHWDPAVTDGFAQDRCRAALKSVLPHFRCSLETVAQGQPVEHTGVASINPRTAEPEKRDRPSGP